MDKIAVAPFVGAWIEISTKGNGTSTESVAPFVGAWIEMVFAFGIPTKVLNVAPFVGAWIEIASLLTVS